MHDDQALGDRIEGRDYLECPCCGGEGAEPDAEGMYADGQGTTCGCPGYVVVDSETPPYISGWDEGECPKCDRTR
jgi:hypothetical protein